MLPPPTLTFTIPSIHDDTVLDCRIYHPASLASGWEKKAAIIAHPYAPLGGCYDDPIVDIVASVILKQCFVVGTFNFRGAGSSKGKTSWTAKPERDDYISFAGFMAYYLHYLHIPITMDADPDEFHLNLATIPSHALPPAQIQPPIKRHTSPAARRGLPEQSLKIPRRSKDNETEGLLLLAGYSYGSLITTHLPHTNELLSLFSEPEVGSAASEIRLRAEHLAKQQNELLATLASSISSHRGRHSLQIGETRSPLPHSPGVRIGGEETNPNIRRSSQEGRRSFDSTRLRKSLDKVRSISHHNPPPSRQSSYNFLNPEETQNSPKATDKSEKQKDLNFANSEINSKPKIIPPKMEPIEMMQLRTAYLLISPLQGIVKELATMSIFRSFNATPKHTSNTPTSSTSQTSHAKANHHDINKLAQSDTLAIFGSTDSFTSAKKLRSWATKLQNQSLLEAGFEDGGSSQGGESSFQWREVEGAGHFWHDYEHITILRDEVKAFIKSL